MVDGTRPEPLLGRVALVTGASRGIGHAVALRLAAAGALVAVVARTTATTASMATSRAGLPGDIDRTCADIRAAGGIAFPFAADLARPDERARVVAAVAEELGPVDVLVNNAAVTHYLGVEEMPDGGYRAMFDVLVDAPYELSRLVLPSMRARDQGWIVNITSKVARHPDPAAPADRPVTVYGMCKAALDRFTTGLAVELEGTGITVNAVAPAHLVLTPGAIHRGLATDRAVARAEPVDALAEAALVLATCDPRAVRGRVLLTPEALALAPAAELDHAGPPDASG